MMKIDEVLEHNEKTHGYFNDTARIAQALKYAMEHAEGSKWDELQDDQAEALAMIANKIARILSGNPCEPDHWLDIEGYAKLGGRRAQANYIPDFL
jgi:hypothetical protein